MNQNPPKNRLCSLHTFTLATPWKHLKVSHYVRSFLVLSVSHWEPPWEQRTPFSLSALSHSNPRRFSQALEKAGEINPPSSSFRPQSLLTFFSSVFYLAKGFLQVRRGERHLCQCWHSLSALWRLVYVQGGTTGGRWMGRGPLERWCAGARSHFCTLIRKKKKIWLGAGVEQVQNNFTWIKESKSMT